MNAYSWGHFFPSKQTISCVHWATFSRQLISDLKLKEANEKLNIVMSLVKVMDRLTCVLPMVFNGDVVHQDMPGLVEFNEAFNIYKANIVSDCTLDKKLKETFQRQLLHETYGLPVMVISHKVIGKWIILRTPFFSLEYVITQLLSALDTSDNNNSVHMEFSFSELKSLMSSDFDRKLLELALSVGRSNRELEILNINIANGTNEIEKRITDIRELNLLAEQKAEARIDSEISSLVSAIQEDACKLEIKTGRWPVAALTDLKEKIKLKESRLEELKNIKKKETDYFKLIFQRRVQYSRDALIHERRLNKLGRAAIHKKQGAKRKLTDSDDEYVASMFNEHAGYHGLRNTATEYLGTIDRNKRIKLEDIKKYYNIRRIERGERIISKTTARRRLAPRKKSSREAKTYTGKCLISVAVPPRTLDSSNENTHFARKFRTNVEKCLFSKSKFLEEIRDIESNVKVLFKSKDDAHYVAPGTKEGFDRARQKKIYCPVDTDKRLGIPKYDFPDSTLYQTPGSHRILQKVSVESDLERDKLARDSNWDFHHVYIRPKITQDSSGITWASEDIDLIIKEPFTTSDVIENESLFSKDEFSCLRAIELEIKLFLLMQNSEDEKFIAYNSARIENLRDKLLIQASLISKWPLHGDVSIVVREVLDLLDKVLEECDRNETVFSLVPESITLITSLRTCLNLIKIPRVKPIRVDCVDSGPGQAPGQKDVMFCDKLLFRLLDSTYYCRLSLADRDSYMNYAERTNSAIRQD